MTYKEFCEKKKPICIKPVGNTYLPLKPNLFYDCYRRDWFIMYRNEDFDKHPPVKGQLPRWTDEFYINSVKDKSGLIYDEYVISVKSAIRLINKWNVPIGTKFCLIKGQNHIIVTKKKFNKNVRNKRKNN